MYVCIDTVNCALISFTCRFTNVLLFLFLPAATNLSRSPANATVHLTPGKAKQK